MSRISSLFAAIAALIAALTGAPAAAQGFALVSLPVIWIQPPTVLGPQDVIAAEIFEAPPLDLPLWRPETSETQRFVTTHRPRMATGVLQYGPFRVVDGGKAMLVGETDSDSPRWFEALLRDHPGLTRLEMVECPGTLDDRANMRLGRMIRAAGLATHVPAHGSVRSGAVELFLAGAVQTLEEGAEFAVHSWRDVEGREAADFAPDAPENRAYLDYYREMGMTSAQARAFYDFTNSVPHSDALWLEAEDMRPWLAPEVREEPVDETAPRIAYASLT
ncbi:alpha/beta hydrolase [Qipengyuania spongiae]|uniref:Alpha/beta hydrolase n=1 Tax=Qipengyuania spongiae TaxID=2909673 RepID=A0ABY5T257_9SPHN|nr:alpha/beta hydrolase [Qipengyuania spongiae]UVI39408.1 alpha/beta hydrolase [Qipengyuania spongiae]